MQKNHSFLKGIKDKKNKLFKDLFSIKISKYKNVTMSAAYILATALVVINPNSISGNEPGLIATAQVVPGINIEKETEHATIIQTNDKNDFLTEVESIQLLQMQTVVDKNTNEENNITIDKEGIGDYINVTEGQEALALDEKEQAVKEKAAQEAAARAAEQEAERLAAEEAAIAEQKAAEEAAAEEAAAAEAQAAEAAAASKLVNYTSNDAAILERIVEAEATGEDVKGKILVANVIVNRVKDNVFPNSIEGVVFQKNQFSPISDGRYYSVNVTDTTKEAVSRALQGEDYSQGALYFSARQQADAGNMSWFDNNLTYLFQHGGHEFFR